MNLTFFVLLFLPLFHSPPPVSAQSIGCSVAGECAHSNVVGIVSTDSNYFCLESCQNTTACNFYTLYSSDEVCVLTSDCGSFETGTCLNCVSGEVMVYELSPIEIGDRVA